ncbi:MAG: 2,3-bisphosphoglycerate-independent phosphoglycerate mutase [Firmicutes bacterium]|nr:2,3-bisphosphoglycerate-independent phosphoglycerate mutase [Candidatus Fermentithermobacillaceae bacterium]
MSRPRPVVLVILDGWGISETAPSAVTEANIPYFRSLGIDYPTASLEASGEAVGLMPSQMGDSNVGHLNLGAGRIVYQDLVRIFNDIKTGHFYNNEALLFAMDNVIDRGSALHVMGLLSDGGVHSHEEHLYAILEMAKSKGLSQVFIHVFLDGRDVPPQSAHTYLERLEKRIADIGIGKISSITGRYWAMDRDNRWERTKTAYDLLTLGRGRRAPDWRSALEMAYEQGETDEFVCPTIVDGRGDFKTVDDGDSLVFFNFRADRARQISHAFCDKEFKEFYREKHPDIVFVGMLCYEEHLDGLFAYSPLVLRNTLGEVVSNAGMRQLRIAETEKYAHVTFFFNGKREQPFAGEDWCLIPSPKVPTYDEKPEMSAFEVTDEALRRLEKGAYDLVILNYANPDMVGHTGCFEAAKKALEVVDQCLSRLLPAVVEMGGIVLLVSDHGNVEDLTKPKEEPGCGENKNHTYHTSNRVPCILVGKKDESTNKIMIDRRIVERIENGILSDVAPTILDMMGLGKPAEMDRNSLITYA